MKKTLLSIVALVVAFGLGYQVKQVSQEFGGSSTVETFPVRFVNGLKSGTSEQLSISSTGALSTSGGLTTTGALSAATYGTASIGSSSSSPAALGSAASGHFIIATGQTTASASTTAVTANSTILLTMEETTPIAGTTCNATTTAISVLSKTAHATNGGFRASVETAPGVNPICVAYQIIN